MGCRQSSFLRYSELTDEDIKRIPQVFRDANHKSLSPGMDYWFSTCFFREGKLPIDINGDQYSVEYTCITKYGYYPSEKTRTTQDAYSFVPYRVNINEKETNGLFMGVYDGHGEYGNDCSNLCKDYMENVIQTNTSVQSENAYGSLFLSSLEECNCQMHKKKYDGGLDDTNSGTTAVCVSIVGSTITCVNVGDSRCVAGFCSSDRIYAIPLSFDHTPFRDDERSRVKLCGGDVLTFSDRIPSHSNLMNKETKGYSLDDPPRVYLKNCGYPGTAFSRSVGDSLAESVGVIAQGEVVSKRIASGLNHIICGSDGIWNFCTSEELSCSLRYATDLTKTAYTTVLNLFLRWIKSCSSSDDITLLVIRLPVLSTGLDENNQDWNVSESMDPDSVSFIKKLLSVCLYTINI